jgi:hypothetical protein
VHHYHDEASAATAIKAIEVILILRQEEYNGTRAAQIKRVPDNSKVCSLNSG